MNELLDFMQQVKRANDIVDVIGSYIELRQHGTNFVARCPFHGEKTPSFNVSRNLQIFKCFGCGESGDVLKFVQMYESCSFLEALEILAKRAGLKMPETHAQKRDKTYDEKKKKRDTYLAICREAAVFYYKTFYSSRGEVARKYMQKRGFDEETLKKFGVGYSPDRFSLVNYLESKNFSHDDCVACGVLQRNSSGSVSDALADRLIVPIFNVSGKVIAFGGRGLDEKTISFGKYKNTSDTPLFTKKDNVFGLNFAKEQKQRAALPNIVMMEGYMDVMASYQAGFKRAVASMGTSLTENQAKLLSRLTETVYICYDGDSAGQKATVRGLDILDKAGLEVQVMSVPENLDPDEYIKKYGAEEFEKLVNQAKALPDYKLELLQKAFPLNTDSRTRNKNMPKFVNGAVKMLKQLDDVRQAHYVAQVAAYTGYSQEFFRRKLDEPSENSAEEVVASDSVTSGETKAKYFVAACLLTNQPYATLDEKPYCETDFLSRLFDYVSECLRNGQKPQADMIYTLCPNASQEEYSQIVDVDFSEERQEKNKKYFDECKGILAVESLKRQQSELTRRFKENPEQLELLSQITEINKKIDDILKRR